MLSKLRARMTYANVMSTLALALALGGGTAYAATRIGTGNIRYHAVTGSKLANNAVTASKVKNGALSGSDIRDNSLTGTDVRSGSLQASDFAAGQLPKGDKGDPATSIYGVVTQTGGLTNFKNVTAISGDGTAGYTATINQDVSKCAVVATLQGGGAGSITAEPTSGQAQQVTVHTYQGGVESPRGFQFAVYC